MVKRRSRTDDFFDAPGVISYSRQGGSADIRRQLRRPRNGIVTAKIEAVKGETPLAFGYGNVFAREDVGGRARLRVGIDEAHAPPSQRLRTVSADRFRCSTCCIRPAPGRSSVGTRAQS